MAATRRWYGLQREQVAPLWRLLSDRMEERGEGSRRRGMVALALLVLVVLVVLLRCDGNQRRSSGDAAALAPDHPTDRPPDRPTDLLLPLLVLLALLVSACRHNAKSLLATRRPIRSSIRLLVIVQYTCAHKWRRCCGCCCGIPV